MIVGSVLRTGLAAGLVLSLAAVALPAPSAWAQYYPSDRSGQPYYRDYPPAARDYPPPVYRGAVPPVEDDDDGPVVVPPYRTAPRGAPDRGPYTAVPPEEDPYAPPAAGPYAAPPRYGARPYEPGPPPGQPDLRPPMGIGPDNQANAPGAPVRPGAPATTPDGQSIYSSLPPEDRPEVDAPKELPPQLRKQLVAYPTREPAGTIVIDTPNTYLYLVLGNGKAMRYGIGVGREGFTWSGVERVSRMAEWPDWHPPKEMIERQPYLPRFMAGGPGNPLGARALYLGKTLFRIHGTNQPSTIGSFVSSGCVRLLNEDIEDLYQRVQVGSRVVVLPGRAPPPSAQNTR
jgi:lipoprotein-anchoring transpeptidase ErfK/SrfK